MGGLSRAIQLCLIHRRAPFWTLASSLASRIFLLNLSPIRYFTLFFNCLTLPPITEHLIITNHSHHRVTSKCPFRFSNLFLTLLSQAMAQSLHLDCIKAQLWAEKLFFKKMYRCFSYFGLYRFFFSSVKPFRSNYKEAGLSLCVTHFCVGSSTQLR